METLARLCLDRVVAPVVSNDEELIAVVRKLVDSGSNLQKLSARELLRICNISL